MENKVEQKTTSSTPMVQQPITTVDWSKRGWRFVDLRSKINLAHVIDIDLDDSLLTEIPRNLVTALPLLEQLSAARNQLKCLPYNIGDWNRLKVLSVPNNRISFLPLSMSRLNRLQYLNMEGNPISPSVCSMFHLGHHCWDLPICQKFARSVCKVAAYLPAELEKDCYVDYQPDVPSLSEKTTLPLISIKNVEPPLRNIWEDTPRRRTFPTESISDDGSVQWMSDLFSGSLVESLTCQPTISIIPPWVQKISKVLLKMVAFILCLFALTVLVSGVLIDQGFLDKFFASSTVGPLIPVWFRVLFTSCHNMTLKVLSVISYRFPIYRTPSPGYFKILLNFMASLLDYTYAIPY